MEKKKFIELAFKSDEDAIRLYNQTKKPVHHRQQFPNPTDQQKINFVKIWAIGYQAEYRVCDFLEKNGANFQIERGNWEAFMEGDEWIDVSLADLIIYSVEQNRWIPVDIKSTQKKIFAKEGQVLQICTQNDWRKASFDSFGNPHNAVKILVYNPNQNGDNLFYIDEKAVVKWRARC